MVICLIIRSYLKKMKNKEIEDFEILKKWLETSEAKHIIVKSSEAGYILGFARYYHKLKLEENEK